MIDWDKFVKDYMPLAQSVAYKLLGDWHTAQDVASKAISSCWMYGRRGALDESRSYRNFVVACARNAAYSEMRRRRLSRCEAISIDIPEVVDAPTSHDSTDDDARRVRDAIRTLGGMQGTCARLFYLSGYSGRQIGAQLGCSPITVRTQLHRARETLRRNLHDIDLD